MKKVFLLAATTLLFTSFAGLTYAAYDSAKGGEIKKEVSAIAEQTAFVDRIEGKAVLTKPGSPVERELKEGDEISSGDTVFTEAGASISISFDENGLNTVNIPANSKAIFMTIHPTSIWLEDGSVFSSVDGLAEGSTWEVATPVATAGVRGTEFEIEYSRDSGDFSAFTYDDENEKKSSAVELRPAAGGEAIKIIEGRQMSFKRGQKLSPQLVQKMTTDRMRRGKQMKKEVMDNRKRAIQHRKKRESDGGPQNPGGPNGPGNNHGALNQEGRPMKPGVNGMQPRQPNPALPLPAQDGKKNPPSFPLEKLEKPNMPPQGSAIISSNPRPAQNKNQPRRPTVNPEKTQGD